MTKVTVMKVNSSGSGPVLGGVQRARRGPLFWLFFAGGYRLFWPAPAATPWWAVPVYYSRIVLWTVWRANSPRYLVWLMRWAFTLAALIYVAVLVCAVLALAAVGLWGWLV